MSSSLFECAGCHKLRSDIFTCVDDHNYCKYCVPGEPYQGPIIDTAYLRSKTYTCDKCGRIVADKYLMYRGDNVRLCAVCDTDFLNVVDTSILDTRKLLVENGCTDLVDKLYENWILDPESCTQGQDSKIRNILIKYNPLDFVLPYDIGRYRGASVEISKIHHIDKQAIRDILSMITRKKTNFTYEAGMIKEILSVIRINTVKPDDQQRVFTF